MFVVVDLSSSSAILILALCSFSDIDELDGSIYNLLETFTPLY